MWVQQSRPLLADPGFGAQWLQWLFPDHHQLHHVGRCLLGDDEAKKQRIYQHVPITRVVLVLRAGQVAESMVHYSCLFHGPPHSLHCGS